MSLNADADGFVRIERQSLDQKSPIFFDFEANGWPLQGFVVKLDGQAYAYVNRCAHLPFTLDLGDEDILGPDGTSLVCHNHGAEFNITDGVCTLGPCEGQSLEALEISATDGDTLLIDIRPVDQDRPPRPQRG